MVEFRIVSQQHEWTFDAQGNRHGQWTVTFVTDSGVQSQVLITDESYHPETVAHLIATEAKVIEDVQSLTRGEETPRRPAHVTLPAQHHAA